MPRRSKGARLHLRPARYRAGKLTHQATWVIRDGTGYYATGCAEREVAAAEQVLKDYIAKKYAPTRKEQDLEKIPVADVLSIFIDDRPDLYVENSDAQKYLNRIGRLKEFWGKLMLSEVTRTKCREYQQHRGNKGGARRDLEDLRAAIANHAAEGLHRGIVKVSLPKKGPARDRWLTRDEAAHLIWTCWRAREIQTMHRGPNKGQQIETNKRPLRHLARFILIGVYSGTRAGAIASASPTAAIGRSFVDLERGVYYRRAQGKQETNKRQPPIPTALAGTPATLEGAQDYCAALCRVQRRRCIFREDRVQACGDAGQAWARRFAAYATAHRGNVVDAERYRPMASRRVSRHERRNIVARVRAPPPGPPEGCRRQDDGQAYRLSFASETNRKDEDERRQNSMKMGTSSGNTASFRRS